MMVMMPRPTSRGPLHYWRSSRTALQYPDRRRRAQDALERRAKEDRWRHLRTSTPGRHSRTHIASNENDFAFRGGRHVALDERFALEDTSGTVLARVVFYSRYYGRRWRWAVPQCIHQRGCGLFSKIARRVPRQEPLLRVQRSRMPRCELGAFQLGEFSEQTVQIIWPQALRSCIHYCN